jgi:phage replication-related protein YjqB (UPF0714/DUF867 family)
MSGNVPRQDLSFREAWRRDESVETLWHPEHNNFLCALAPHGGDIEAGTDEAAAQLFKSMPDGSCSMWAFHGFGDDAFDRYHVTSTDISPDRFPKLGAIEDVGFQHCVSFHVKGNADVIEVGGAADRDFRRQVADVIEDAVKNNWSAEHRYEEIKYEGSSNTNVTNWLTCESASGVQIELPISAARNYRKRIGRGLSEHLYTQIRTG